MATLAEIRAKIAARDKKKLDKRKAAGAKRKQIITDMDKKYRAAKEKRRLKELDRKAKLRDKGSKKALKEGRLNDAANLKSNANLARTKKVTQSPKAKKAQMDKYTFKQILISIQKSNKWKSRNHWQESTTSISLTSL